jgi:hypothetical protein
MGGGVMIDYEKMDDRELTKIIAEMIGWTYIIDRLGEYIGYKPGEPFGSQQYPLLDYLTSLDAAAEVEAEIARRGLVNQYVYKMLDQVVGKPPGDIGIAENVFWNLLHAKPKLRMIAAARVLEGK